MIKKWEFYSSDEKLVDDICNRYNLTDNAEGAWFMALLTDGKTEDEANNEILEKRKISN